jgi:hypothetical protein
VRPSRAQRGKPCDGVRLSRGLGGRASAWSAPVYRRYRAETRGRGYALGGGKSQSGAEAHALVCLAGAGSNGMKGSRRGRWRQPKLKASPGL